MGDDFDFGPDYDTPQEAAWAAFRGLAAESGKSLAKRRLLVARFQPGEDEPDMVWCWLPASEMWEERWPDPLIEGLEGLTKGLPEVKR